MVQESSTSATLIFSYLNVIADVIRTATHSPRLPSAAQLYPFWVQPSLGVMVFAMKTIYSPAYHSLLAWLRTCRLDKGLTMRQLGKRLGMPHSWVGKVEIGERRLDVEEYVRLCHALEIEPGKGIAIVHAALFPTAVLQTSRSPGLKAAESKTTYRIPRRKP